MDPSRKREKKRARSENGRVYGREHLLELSETKLEERVPGT